MLSYSVCVCNLRYYYNISGIISNKAIEYLDCMGSWVASLLTFWINDVCNFYIEVIYSF